MNIEPTGGRKRLRLKHVGSILEGDVDRPYIAKGLFEPNSLNVIFGEPGSGKSFLALYFGYQVNMGRPVFGRRVRQSPVLFVGLEGEAGLERRIVAAIKRGLRISSEYPAELFFVTEPLDLFGGIGDAEAIMDAAAAIREEHTGKPPKLIIIDTLARAFGAGSENDPSDMAAMIAVLDAIRFYTGAAVVVVHHSGKDKTKGMRGHSSLLAACDSVIEVEKSDGGGHSFRVVKSKDGPSGDSFPFTLDVVELGIDQDGDPITSCVVREGEPDPNARKAVRLPPAAKAALDHLHRCICDLGKPAPMSTHIPASVQTVTLDQWKDHLVKAGILNRDGNPREQFKRARVTLQNARAIGVWDGLVWTVT